MKQKLILFFCCSLLLLSVPLTASADGILTESNDVPSFNMTCPLCKKKYEHYYIYKYKRDVILRLYNSVDLVDSPSLDQSFIMYHHCVFYLIGGTWENQACDNTISMVKNQSIEIPMYSDVSIVYNDGSVFFPQTPLVSSQIIGGITAGEVRAALLNPLKPLIILIVMVVVLLIAFYKAWQILSQTLRGA